MGDGGNGRNAMADVAVKDFGNLMAALDFVAFVIDEFDVVADISVQVVNDVFHDAVRHADQLQAAADKDVLERTQTGGVALREFHDGGSGHLGINAVDGVTDGAQAFGCEGFVADVLFGNEQQVDDFGEFAVFALFGGNEEEVALRVALPVFRGVDVNRLFVDIFVVGLHFAGNRRAGGFGFGNAQTAALAFKNHVQTLRDLRFVAKLLQRLQHQRTFDAGTQGNGHAVMPRNPQNFLDFKLAALAAAVFFVEEGQQQTCLLQGKPFVFG